MGPLLTWLADNQGALYGLKVSVQAPDEVVVHEEHLRILLYQLVRELLFNVAKHAHTTSARIVAERDGPVVRILVEDDGVGFQPPTVSELHAGRGLGLSSVWDRLALVGGALRIESAPGEGTRVVLEVPSGPEAA
jgi:signal transduction histidine kinase